MAEAVRSTSSMVPGRFEDLDVAEAYRWGFRPVFDCSWCRRPMMGLGGTGNLCVPCDLAMPVAP